MNALGSDCAEREVETYSEAHQSDLGLTLIEENYLKQGTGSYVQIRVQFTMKEI